MSHTHPTDEQLLLHAEGEPDPVVDEHLSDCPDCRTVVEESIRGGEALRAAALLDCPAAVREEALATLPPLERARGRRRRFLGVAVPLVALASAVAVVGLTRGTTDPERTAEQMAAQDAGRAAEESADDAPSAALEAPPVEDDAARTPDAQTLRSVAGPAAEVAAALRAQGFDAEVVGGAVEVAASDAEEVERALRARADGPVEVRLRDR